MSHTRSRVGSRKESFPPITWTESGRTTVLTESSSSRKTVRSSRLRDGAIPLECVRQDRARARKGLGASDLGAASALAGPPVIGQVHVLRAYARIRRVGRHAANPAAVPLLR